MRKHNQIQKCLYGTQEKFPVDTKKVMNMLRHTWDTLFVWLVAHAVTEFDYSSVVLESEQTL